jgi:hypothetical protein
MSYAQVLHMFQLLIYNFLLFLSATAIDISEIAIDDVLSPQNYFGGSDHESYLSWYNRNESSYAGRMYLPADGTTTSNSNNGVAIHWKVDEIQENIISSNSGASTSWMDCFWYG